MSRKRNSKVKGGLGREQGQRRPRTRTSEGPIALACVAVDRDRLGEVPIHLVVRFQAVVRSRGADATRPYEGP